MLGLERPPRWALVALTAFVVADLVLFAYLAFVRTPPADPLAGQPAPTLSAAATAGETTPAAAPSTIATSSEPAQTPVLAVYGDGYSVGSTLGGQGATGWPALVAAAVGADLDLSAVSMAGYAATGTTGQTFPELVAADPAPAATVTIVFGSRNDEGQDPTAVGTAALETMTTIRANAPETRLLVIGPAWSSADVPADLAPVRDAVQQAAATSGATFVDPLAERWFADPAGLIASDGISPLDAGHTYLADLIAPTVEAELTAA